VSNIRIRVASEVSGVSDDTVRRRDVLAEFAVVKAATVIVETPGGDK
jgi:hypothetical protein